MNAKKGSLLMALILMISLLSGCWSNTDLKNLALVIGMAIDRGSDDGEYEVTLQIANPNAFKLEGGGDSEAYVNYSDTGVGMEKTIHKIKNQVERQLYTGHNQLIIISREAAESGIEPILDYLVRSSDARFTVSIYISEGPAKDTLAVGSELEPLPAEYIRKLSEAQLGFGEASQSAMIDFLNHYRSGISAPTLPVVAVQGEGEEQSVKLNGIAVFSGASLCTLLTPELRDAMQLAAGKGKDEVVQIDIQDGYLLLETKNTSVEMKPVFDGDRLERFTVKLKMECLIVDTSVGLDILSADIRDELEGLANEAVAEQLRQVLTETQAYGADIFGFGLLLQRCHPGKAASQLARWPDSYASLTVDFTVETDITSTGTSLRTIDTGR